MIVAYVSEKDMETRQKIEEAVKPERVTFRDPESFDPSQADPLDHAVYVGGGTHGRAIRKAYESLGSQVMDAEAEELEKPPQSFEARRAQLREERAAQEEKPMDPAAAPNVKPPSLENPAASQRKRGQRSAADEATQEQEKVSAEHSDTKGDIPPAQGQLGGSPERQVDPPRPSDVRPSARETT